MHLICFVYRPGTPSYRLAFAAQRFPVSVYSRRVQNQYPCERSAILHGESSRALTAIGIFLFFGAIMACLAGTPLLWRGTVLERMWTLNPAAFKQLVPFGTAAGIVFILLGVTLAVAGAAWFKRRLWAWRLAVAIIATQVLGDLVNVVRGDLVRGAICFTIAGALLFYLLRSEVRAAFAKAAM